MLRISSIDWDIIWQGHQRIMATLAKQGKQVIFVEATNEIEKYYRAANAFVLPSSREGLPNAMLEAMATGLPCVASKLQGVTDVVIDHGINGLLVSPGDVAALVDALGFLLQDPTRTQELRLWRQRVWDQPYTSLDRYVGCEMHSRLSTALD